MDGSVTADHFIYDKVQNTLADKVIGKKEIERRLNLVEGGGVNTIQIDDEKRQNSCSLSDEQLEELVRLIMCIDEEENGAPMDVELCINEKSEIVLLQAGRLRPCFG